MKYLVVTTTFGKRHNAIDTFCMVIDLLVKEYGLEKVIEADHERVVISKDQYTVDYSPEHPACPSGNYYISTNHDPGRKKFLLDRITDRLSFQLKVETPDRNQ